MKIKKIITNGGCFDLYFGKDPTIKANPLHCRAICSGDLLNADLLYDPSLGCYPKQRRVYNTNYSFSDLEKIISDSVKGLARDSAKRIMNALKK